MVEYHKGMQQGSPICLQLNLYHLASFDSLYHSSVDHYIDSCICYCHLQQVTSGFGTYCAHLVLLVLL